MRFPLADKDARRLSKKEIGQLLTGPNLLRLAFLDGGTPMVHPVWFVYEEEKFWIAVDREGAKARSIRENPGVYFLVDVGSSPPRGVRGRGTARGNLNAVHYALPLMYLVKQITGGFYITYFISSARYPALK